MNLAAKIGLRAAPISVVDDSQVVTGEYGSLAIDAIAAFTALRRDSLPKYLHPGSPTSSTLHGALTETSTCSRSHSLLSGDGVGTLIRVSPDGTTKTTVTDSLFWPGGLALRADGSFYISQCSVCAGAGEVVRVEP